MKRRAAALQRRAVVPKVAQAQSDAAEEVADGESQEDDVEGVGTSQEEVGNGGGEEEEDGSGHESDLAKGDDNVDDDAEAEGDQLSNDAVTRPLDSLILPAAPKHKPGVCYLSRLPPHMTPQQLRDILNYQGRVSRVYATPEAEHLRKKRKKKGGNNKMNYTEAWVEFERRATAKRVAATLNNTQIGGPKRAFYHDDLWNIKYLKKFTWHHLTEKMRYEKRVREQKLRSEIALAKRETNAYLEQVQKAKTARKIEERKQAKVQKDEQTASKSHAAKPKLRTKDTKIDLQRGKNFKLASGSPSKKGKHSMQIPFVHYDSR